MNVMVIGGMGSIGSFVTRLLVESQLHPCVFSRHKDISLLKDVNESSYTFTQGDVTDILSVIRAVGDRNTERIIYLAAAAYDSQSNPAGALKINVEGLLNVLEAARLFNIRRVVFASAKRALGPISGEYGYPTYKPVSEEYVPRPLHVYDVTKFTAERLGFNYARNYKMDFVAVRFSQTYGPGRLHFFQEQFSKDLNCKMIENAMLGKSLRIPWGGDEKNDLIYTKDVARGLVKLCLAENLGHHLFHLGTGIGSTLDDFARAIRTIFPEARYKIGPRLVRAGRANYQSVFDISLIRKEISFEPVYSLEAGIKDYVQTVKDLEIPLTWTDMTS
jgi:UDP-glucose 4-epimerase